MKKYLIQFKFRSGQSMEIKAESVVLTKGRNSPYFQLHIDGEPVVTAEKGSPNFDANNNYRIFNSSPLPKLYDMMPNDWDKNIPSLKIIDEIFVRTQKG